MKSSRLEAFSDGVMAIIITIMVLEIKAPDEVTIDAIIPLFPIFLSYLLSFIYIGIYWNNHHHLFQITKSVNGKVLWANLHLLFWLSLIPFATSWISEHHVAAGPVAFYGFILIMASVAYLILQATIISHHDEDFALRNLVGKDIKGKASFIIYVLGTSLSFVSTWIAMICYIIVALIWIVPDIQIEKNID